MKTRMRRGITLTLSYLVIALVMTEPLIFHFSNYSMTGLDDGASLTFHSMPKVQGLVGIPLQYLAGFTIAYNIIFLLTFLLTALATYWLVYHLLGERLPAFIAGVLFAYCPARWGHLGHTQLLSTMLIPVCILFVIKGREELEGG